MDKKVFVKKYVLPIPIIGDIVLGLFLGLFRLKFGLSYLVPPINQLFRWLIRSREVDNFTYDLTADNIAYLTAFVAAVSTKSFQEIKNYVDELMADKELANFISVHENPGYGRRIGWYAMIRAKKSKIVVETGVDKGLGACVIAAALLRNAAEGFPGKYYGTEINPQGGYLFTGKYGKAGKILYGDSLNTLKRFRGKVDIFINDSDHSPSYEYREYQTISPKLKKGAIIIGDNAHASNQLLKFSLETGRKFLFFQEKPKDHWYPGGGIGVSY